MCFVGTTAEAFGFDLLKEIRPHTTDELAALRAEAEKNSIEAEIEYGKALEYEKFHGDKSVTDADVQGWFRKAADQGSGEGWFWLGFSSRDQKLAQSAYEHAAELGFEPAFDDLFDRLLFRAGEQADVIKAKQFADLARLKGIKIYDAAAHFATIDACYDAGSADVPEAERAAIARDKRNDDRFTPNNNIKFAQAYANGWGVKPNPKLAIALVCRGADVPAEMIGMVRSLKGWNEEPAPASTFLFCDHITSGMNGGMCSSYAEHRADASRSAALDDLSRTWTAPQKNAYVHLRRTAEIFFDTHAREERDMSGTARVAIASDEMGRLRNGFLASLQAFEHGRLPAHEGLGAADNELNTLYREILSMDWNYLGTLTPEGLRSTQRAWLKYRDAWAEFGAVRYPRRTAAEWKAWATRQRTAQLQETYPDILRKKR